MNDENISQKLKRLIETVTHGEIIVKMLGRLAVCQGGFTPEAAQAIATLPKDRPVPVQAALQVLREWDLVQQDPQTFRYTMALPVAIAAAENQRKQERDPLWPQTAHQAHYEHFLGLAQAHSENWRYDALQVESANLEVAFEWAFGKQHVRAAYVLYQACGPFLAQQGQTPLRLNWIKRLAEALAKDQDKILWAQAQDGLGMAYRSMAALKNRTENLHRAVNAYQQPLKLTPPSLPASLYAGICNNLAVTYQTLATLENPVENLQAALESYEQAARYHPADVAPFDAALIHRNRGNAYLELAELEKPLDHLQAAISAFQEGLNCRLLPNAPQLYADIQGDLGNAYQTLAQWKLPGVNLLHSIAAYEAALKYLDMQVMPLAYAFVQTNLGAAYRTLSTLQNPAENLQRAIRAYEAALSHYKPDVMPLFYAQSQQNMGLAYRSAGNFDAAIACWEGAAHYYARLEKTQNAQTMRQWIQDLQDIPRKS
jgi:tetratricopeptide (TPR) repeat protein